MPIKNNEKGFTYFEVVVAILVMTIGVLALLSAISIGVLRAREAEQRNYARQFTAAALESVFATRDLQQVNRNLSALRDFGPAVANNTPGTPQGVFLTGFNPIREDSGRDRIEGTADDACPSGSNCVVGGYTNSSQEIGGFDRQIIITDIVDPLTTVIRRKRITVNVRYTAGQTQRVETVSTIIADL